MLIHRRPWAFYSPDGPAGGAPAAAASQPQAGTPASAPANAPAAQATPPAGEPVQPETMSLDEAKKLRQEHNALRKRLAEFEAAQKAADDAKLDELGKANKRLSDLQAAHAELQTQAQERIVRALVRAEAATMGLNPALAARLIDFADIEFDDAGDPKNLAKLLKAAAEAYGLNATPAGQGGTPPRPAASSGGATAPGAGARAGTITKASYAAMSQSEKLARHAEVMAALKANGGRLPD